MKRLDMQKVPLWLLVVASPLIGLAFVIAIPFVLVYGAYIGLRTLAARVFARHAPLAHARFAPTAAFLNPSGQPEPPAAEPVASDPALADLDAEVAARREPR